jgi:TP901 family phage tail tape measure protein
MERSVRVRLEANVSGFVADVGVKAVAAVNKLGDAADKVGTKVNDIGDRSATGVNKMLAAADKNSQHLDKIGSAATKTGVLVGAGLGLAAKAAIDWESAWAGVTKTVDGSTAQMAELEDQLRGMAKTLPATHQEIAAVAEAAGQLGVQRQNIAAFTRVMIDLGETTNLTADEAATSLAQFMNVLQTAPEDVGRLGATVVALGNAGASTERDIVSMAQRIAGVGRVVGLSETQVLGYASALSNVGIEAEAGGSAISTLFFKIDKAVSSGGDSLEAFAQVAGVSATEFKRRFETDAAGASQLFFEGLGRMNEAGADVNATLETLGITEIRQRDATLRLASSGTNLADSLRVAGQGWKDNTALVDEAAKRYATTESQIRIAWNGVKDSAIEAGAVILPVISEVVGGVADMAEAFGSLPDPVQQSVVGLGALVAVGGLVIGGTAKMVTSIAALRAAMVGLGASSTTAATAMGALGKAGVAGLAIAGIYGVVTAVNDFKAATSEADVSKLAGDLIRLGETGKSTGEIAKNFGDDFHGVAGRLGEDGLALSDALKNVAEAGDGTGAKVEEMLSKFPTVTNPLAPFNDTLSQSRDRVSELDQALSTLVDGGNAESAAKAFDVIAGQATAAGLTVDELRRLFPEYSRAVEAAGVDAEIAGGKAKEAASGNVVFRDSLNGVTISADKAEDALEEYITTLFRLPGLVLSLRDAQRGVQAAIDAATTSVKENGRSLDIGTEKGRANQTALDAIASSARALSEAQLRANVSQKTMTASAKTAREEFVRVATRMGLNRAAAIELADKLIKIPKSVHTNVTNSAAAAKTKVVDYKTHGLDNLPKQKSTGVEVTGIPAAKKEVSQFATHVDRTLGGIADENVDIKVNLAYTKALRGGRLGQNPEGKAQGGPIGGWSPTPTADNIPLWGTAGEYMQPVASVDYYGLGFMEALRTRSIPRDALGLASGGPVKSKDTHFGIGVSTGGTSAAAIAAAAQRSVSATGTAIANQITKQLLAGGGGGPAGPPGSVRTFRGAQLNERTISMLLSAERMLGATFRIMQGSYSTRVAASGSTHAGGGVMDTDGPRGWGAAVGALRKAGFAAWHRTPAQGPWGHHIHSVAKGDPSASASAKRQVADYQRGGDGLGGRGMARGGPIAPRRAINPYRYARTQALAGGGQVARAAAQREQAGGWREMRIVNWREGVVMIREIAQDEYDHKRNYAARVGG